MQPPPRFEQLIEQHHDEIHRYLWRGLWSGGSPQPDQQAEDLTQEAFMRAFEAYGSIRSTKHLRAWLYKIATNCLRSHWNRSHVASTNIDHELPLEGPAAQPLERLLDEEREQHLHTAISQLPDKQRLAVIMRHLDGLEYRDIAQVLACSQESARANVSHGLRRLRELLLATATEESQS